MVIGIEVNIVDITRIQEKLTQDCECFLRQTFTINEQRYCLAYRMPAPHLAARLAAKEAVVKILGIGRCSCFIWTDIDIRTSLSGSPYLVLEGKALEIARQLAIDQWHLALTHTRQYAGAFVIAESMGNLTGSLECLQDIVLLSQETGDKCFYVKLAQSSTYMVEAMGTNHSLNE
jgi:holo-[acyl-carrier protein] synthase